MIRLLLSPDSAPGTPPADPVPTAPSPATPPAAPPATLVVLDGDQLEKDAAETVELRRQLADEREGRKRDQVKLSETEDENHRLKTAGTVPPRAKKSNAYVPPLFR